ncbi:hypothetical protein ACTFIR_000626 [Dictyostelium discoideum]
MKNDFSIPYEKGYHIVGINRGKPAKLYYEIYGKKNSKNKVVLVMGFMQPGSAWKFQLDYLLKQPDYEVCIYDNRGIGNSNSLSYSIKTLAHDSIDLVKCLKWKNVNFVGTSLGGSVCIFISSFIEKELINSMTISAPWLGLFAPKIPKGCYLYVKSVLEKNERKKFEISFTTLFSQNYLNSPSLSNPLKTKNESMIDRAIKQPQQKQQPQQQQQQQPQQQPQNSSSKTLFSSLFIVLFLKVSPFILNDIKNKQYLNVCVISGKQDILVDLQSIKNRLVSNIKPMNFKILDSGHCVNIENVGQFNKIIVDHIDESNKLNILKRNNNNNIKPNYLCNNNNNNNNITNYFFKNILKFFKK